MFIDDFRTGFSIWKKIGNFRQTAIQFVFLAVAGCTASVYTAPRLYGRVNELSLPVNLDGRNVIIVLALFHMAAFGMAEKGIVYRAYDRNKDLFYQLAIRKRAGYICTMLQQSNWYAGAFAVLLAVCGDVIMPRCLLALIYTLLYLIHFSIYYSRADSGIYRKKRKALRFFSGWKKRKKRKEHITGTKNPALEVFEITMHGLYQCRSLTVGKILLVLFTICCGKAGRPYDRIFLLADIFLILLNDTYWKKESLNFRYFSEIGIPFSRYLCVHFAAGICFNTAVPLLLFLGISGELAAAAASFCLLSYLLIFWYLAQTYLYLSVRRDKEGVILLYEIIFLVAAALPPASFLAMVWLYKKSAYQWREKECFR